MTCATLSYSLLFSLIWLRRNGHARCINTHGYWTEYLFDLHACNRPVLHGPRGRHWAPFLVPPTSPQLPKPPSCCTSSHARKLFSPMSWYLRVCHRGSAQQWKFLYYRWDFAKPRNCEKLAWKIETALLLSPKSPTKPSRGQNSSCRRLSGISTYQIQFMLIDSREGEV